MYVICRAAPIALTMYTVQLSMSIEYATHMALLEEKYTSRVEVYIYLSRSISYDL